MTSFHDAYKELELYLEQAQEEIGKAVKDLENLEKSHSSDSEDGVTWDPVLPPPKAFRSLDKNNVHSPEACPSSLICLNRVCLVGNETCEQKCLSDVPLTHKLNSTKPSFFVNVNPRSLGRLKESTNSPNTKRRLWKLHPSISFPETARELLLLQKDVEFSGLVKDNCGLIKNDSVQYNSESLSLDSPYGRAQERSHSDTNVLYSDPSENAQKTFKSSCRDDSLSVWADDLLLELDKTFYLKLLSESRYSPFSDSSLSSTKVDDISESDNSTVLNSESHAPDKNERYHRTVSSNNIKLMPLSPDCGIGQLACEISDIFDENNSLNLKTFNDKSRKCSTTPIKDLTSDPPPEFSGDVKVFEQDATEEKLSNLHVLNEKNVSGFAEFCTALSIIEIQETSEVRLNSIEDIKSAPRVIAHKTLELEDCCVSRTICALNSASHVMDHQSPSKCLKLEDWYISQKRECIFSKSYNRSLTYPRISKTPPDIFEFQRAASYTTVNMSEILPSSAKLIQDAVTQTTPLSLSTSSSLTWVSECNCSDWELNNINSDSEESFLETCARCMKERTTNSSSSSSSFELSSDDDDFVNATPGSCSSSSISSTSSSGSSLYLSACSGSSDSFEEASVLVNETKLKTDCNFSLPPCRTFRNNETAFRFSVLGDIFEEQISSDTLSIKSTVSNPVPSYSNIMESQQESASFPSTLKVSRKCKSTSSPHEIAELAVLISNELNLKSVSAPVLRQKQCLYSSSMTESSNNSILLFDQGSLNYEDSCYQVPARSQSAKELNGVVLLWMASSHRTSWMTEVVSSFLSRKFVRSFSERLAGSRRHRRQLPRADRWWWKLRSSRLSELQAIEACSWLRAAGFPQYAQMYEDNLFPIDISVVQKDHAFLSPDSIQSLFRRLNTLNRCADMKYPDHTPRKMLHAEDSDEEEQYALSENWEFLRSSRRWSRINATSDGISEFVAPNRRESVKPSGNCFTLPNRKYLSPEETYCSSHDSVFVDDQRCSPESIRRNSILKPDRISISPTHIGDCSPGSSSGSGGTLSLASDEVHDRQSLRRSGSDRVKEGAKALLKRMESLKGKRKKTKKHENVVYNSGTDRSSSSSLTSSPQLRRSHRLLHHAHDTNSQQNFKKDDDDSNVYSDSECNMVLVLDKWKDTNSNTKHYKQFLTPEHRTTSSFNPDNSSLKLNTWDAKTCVQTDSLQNKYLHPCSSTNKEFGQYNKRDSYYDNMCAPIVVFNDFCDENSTHPYDDENNSTSNRVSSQNGGSAEIIVISNERRDSGVGSSLTRGMMCTHAPWHCFPSHSVPDIMQCPVKLINLSAPQMLLLRKLSLLKLTAMMERFSPSNRTGWSWAVPKFIRRIRNPDYKDKNVFGVPLLLILQRTGQPLPASIQAAIHHLQETALDSTGLFRKSGVRSRIQKLKTLNESNSDNISYEEQQAYDVADMIKQYFRELPEALLTNKLSETFISIFQFIPEDLRLEAIQATLILMPDENREVLQALLEFLGEICQHSSVNQMTATNLAVCLAPSLFHLSSPRSSSSSPRRRKTVGVPDVRELNENRAAYECLSCMISNYKTLFSISEDVVAQSRISSANSSQLTTLEDISCFVYDGQPGFKGYIESCIQMFVKETKEKYKNFVSFSQYDRVEISYKKLSDGHPLRLWKVSTEIEAPPSVLLNRILRERHLWDPFFMKSKVIKQLNNNTEVFHYLCSSLPPHPHCDYCVLRSWRTDLHRGACILIETSVNHPDVALYPGSARALILASRYLIEPCGSGRSRITYLSRVDAKGRSPEWYNRAYGHISAVLLIKLRTSFSHVCTDGPETKL